MSNHKQAKRMRCPNKGSTGSMVRFRGRKLGTHDIKIPEGISRFCAPPVMWTRRVAKTRRHEVAKTCKA